MGVMKLSLLSLSLIACLATQNIGTYDLMLDPGRINSWTTKWASTQLDLSKNNQDAAGVAVTFYINLSNSLVAGVVEVTFPNGFDVRGVTSMTGAVVAGQTVQVPATFSSGVDTTLTITGVTNPAVSGAYGPFALRTRNSSTGQLVDVNLNFGHAFITATEGKLTLDSVTYLTSSTSIVNKAANGLRFKFTINKTLWMHDLVRITVASQFTLINPTCSSADITGKVNNFNSTNASNPHSINCVVNSKNSGLQTLWVYGLSNDLDVLLNTDNKYIDLRVTGFTNPDRDYPDASYIWKVETIRFNTHNVMEAGTANGPNTNPDTFLKYDWKPTWGRAITSIMSGQTMYMDASFTLVNPLPDGGYATVTTNVDTVSWGTSNRCFVVSYLSPSVSCSQANGVTTITGLGRLSAGTTIVVRTLTKFASKTNAAKIVSLFTRSAETWAIDTIRDVAGFEFPLSNVAKQFTFNVLLQTSKEVSAQQAGGTGSETQYIKFQFQGIAGLLAAGTSRVTISCPLTGAADDWQFGVPLTSTNFRYQYKTDASTADFSSGTLKSFWTDAKAASPSQGSTVSFVAGSVAADAKTNVFAFKAGTMQFNAGTDHTTVSELTIGLYVTGLSGLSQVVSSGAIILPRVATNPSTAYECSAVLFDTATATKTASVLVPAYAVSQFQIDMQSFDKTKNDFTYFCSRGTLGGAPLKITFLPSVVDIYPSTTTQSYYVEIELPTDTYFPYVAGTSSFHLSGMTEGEAYPMDSNLSTSPTMIVTNVGGNNSFFHRITGLGNVSPVSTPVEIYFPVGVARNANPVIKLRSYFVRSADPRFKHYTHTTTMDTQADGLYTIDTSANPTTSAFVSQSISSGNNQINGNPMGTSALSFSMKLDIPITGDVYFYVVFPRGYSFSSLKNVQADIPAARTNFPFIKFFSSTNLRFAFPSVLVKATTRGARIDSTATTLISFIGVNVPLGTQSSDIVFVHGKTESRPKEICAYTFTGTLTSVTGKITSISVSPPSIQGRGPNGVDISHTVIFTLPHGIDNGGSILLSLNAAWSSTPASVCIVKGLNDVSSTSFVGCSFSGNDFVISNFADFSTTTLTTVTVSLQHLLPPAVDYRDDTKGMQLIKALTSFGSASIGGTAIDNYELGANSLVTVLPSIQPGVTTYVSISVQPPNAGTVDNDLYLQLSFPYDLPPWTTVSVSVPYPALSPSPDIKDRCFLSPLQYTTCGLVSGAFVVVLKDKYTARTVLELFVDHAVNAPTEVKPPVASMHYVFRCLVSWFGAAVVDDGVTTYRASQEIFPDQKLVNFATGLTPLTFVPRNALENAVYSLSFQNAVPIAIGDAIYVVWPDEFDAYIGNAEQSYSTETGTFYLPCSSAQLGSAYCRVDHWVMVITGTNSVPASTDIKITINNVRNPGAGPTGNFKLMHVNKKGTMLEYSGAFGNVTPTPLANSLEVRSVEVTSRSLSTVADYTFRFYASDSFTRSTELHVVFPAEYDLKLIDQVTGFSCNTYRVSETPSSTRQPDIWNPSIACMANGNTVALPPPTSQTLLSTTDLVTVNLKGVRNPEWSQVRSPNGATWDFDDFDSSIWPIWSWWTSQFKVYVFQGSSSIQSFSSRPYGMLNSAYLGFVQPKRTISVNKYNPQSRSNRIIVYPGTQTKDIEIATANSTVPLTATHLTFTAKTNVRTPDAGMLAYSSFKDDWVMLQEESRIRFRIAADKRLNQGLYYITWTMDEGTIGLSKQYCLPPITLIEVPARASAIYTFKIDEVPAIAVGSSSIPIRVSISNPPHTDVAVNINLVMMPDTITVTPRSLVFRSDIDSLFFYVNVSPSHKINLTPRAELTFTLSGTNADAYAVQTRYTVAIETRYVEVAGNIANLDVINVARASFRIHPAADQYGVLYYQISPKGAPILSFDDIRSRMPNFIYTVSDHFSNLTYNAITRQAAASSNDPPQGVTWSQFRHVKFVEHMTTFSKLGGIVMLQPELIQDIDVTGLWAGSSYQIVAYLDNLNPNLHNSSLILKYVTTLPIADIQPIAITLAGKVSETVQSSLSTILATHFGLNSLRVPSTGYVLVNQTSRVLQATTNVINTTSPTTVVVATTFQFTVLPSRSANQPTPTSIATLSPTARAELIKDITTSLGVTVNSYELVTIPARVEPIWQVAPGVNSTHAENVVIHFQATQGNSACCVALQSTDRRLQSDQVWEGFSYDWSPASKACSAPASQAGLNLVTIPYLNSDTTYYVHCVAGDRYLLWPTLMKYSETVPVPFVTVHTLQFDVVATELSTAVVLTLAAGWALLN